MRFFVSTGVFTGGMWQACVRLALGQEGLITLDQALSVGCSGESLRRHVARGDLERLLPGVYRLSGASETSHQMLRAACLWGGEGTAASHTSAAAILGLGGFNLADLHAVTTRNPHKLPGWVEMHQIRAPLPGTKSVAGVPITPPWITLVDLGSQAPASRVERALDEALHRGIVSLPQLRWALATFGRERHRGTSILRSLLAERGPGYALPESEMEAIFYALLEESDLPPGVRQFWVWDGERWRRLDYAFPDPALGVEFDGLETHGTREAFQHDRESDRRLQILGWRVLRFTWDDVTRRPQQFLAQVQAMIPPKHARGARFGAI
jgi:hypothetical protein